MSNETNRAEEQIDALTTYMTDHYAGATGGRDLARHLRDKNRDTEWGDLLEQIVEEIVSEREDLGRMLEALGSSPSTIKNTGAWIGERARRLKPHTDPTSYTDLDRLVEFEALFLGVSGKLSMWRNLAEIDRPELREFDLAGLRDQAERQRDQLDQARLEAARIAFGAVPS